MIYLKNRRLKSNNNFLIANLRQLTLSGLICLNKLVDGTVNFSVHERIPNIHSINNQSGILF
jgi:hypothetical protein